MICGQVQVSCPILDRHIRWGEQTLLLAFDTPQAIHQIILEVEEPVSMAYLLLQV
jgi:hypothetical protein